MKFNSKRLIFLLIIDLSSLIFILVVNLISLRVYFFRKSYMRQDLSSNRFRLVLLTFVLSMYLLILSPNLLRLLIGWDGLGISSYLLVIYYMSNKSYNSGIITAISNRIGDSLLIVRLSLLFFSSSVSSYFLTFNRRRYIFWFILIAATTKRAQIPFRAWLPAAIAAPTPVSALVHSSTLVTAGVYLIFRFIKFSIYFPLNNYLILIGSITIIIARIRALVEVDLKKLIALSTLSQLGVMILALGRKNFNLALFHLFSHAFFKALIFIAAGQIIHTSSSYQDLRIIRNLIKQLPLTSSVFLLCNVRLSGLPFFSRFYSKELILESMIISNSSPALYFLIFRGVILTIIYRFRIIFCRLIIKNISPILRNVYDKDLSINVRIVILLVPALMGGKLLSNILIEFSLLSVSRIRVKLFLIMTIFIVISWFIGGGIFNFRLLPKKWILFNMWSLPIISYRLPLLLLNLHGEKIYMNLDFSYLYLVKINIITGAYLYSTKFGLNFSGTKFFNTIITLVLWAMLRYFL